MDATTATRFRDRRDAGHRLAQDPRLRQYEGREDAIVLALPRGGVPVGHAVASDLGLPLDVFVVRKLGVPGRREMAMGAIASGGVRVVDKRIVRGLGIDERTVAAVAAVEGREVAEQERRFRGSDQETEVRDKIVLLVDDGLATGSTMSAAIQAIRSKDPAKVVVAVPTAPEETCERLRGQADEVICVITPAFFYAVGQWYEDFEQTQDDEVIELLRAEAGASG
jgi:putative phosphoribosyl transferase